MEQTENQSKKEPEKPLPENKNLPIVKVVADVVSEQTKNVVVKPPPPPPLPIRNAESPQPPPLPPASVFVEKDNSGSILLSTDERKPFNKTVLIVPIIFLLLFGVIGAYLGGFFGIPFLGPTHEQVIEKMLNAATTIRSAQYVVDVSFKSEPRQAGIKGYDMVAVINGAGNSTMINAGKRDILRINAISAIQEALNGYKNQNKIFPMFLNDIKVASPDFLLDPATRNQYGYRQEKGGADFTLHVQMETDRGINDFRNAVLVIPSASLQTVENKLAEVHKDTQKLKRVEAMADLQDTGATYDPTMILQNLPAELDANLHIAGFGQTVGESVDTSLNVAGKLNLSGMSFVTDVGLIKKGESVYGKIETIPPLGSLDMSALKGLWVKIGKAELGEIGVSSAGVVLDQTIQPKMTLLIQSFIQRLKDEKVLIVLKEMPKTKVNGETFYRYTVAFNGEKMASIYEKLNAEIKNAFGTSVDYFSPELLTYLHSSEYAKMNAVSQQNAQSEIWINTKTFMPRKFISNSVFVPPDNIQKMKNVQYRARVSLELLDANKPFNVDEPKDSLNVTEAEKMVTGK